MSASTKKVRTYYAISVCKATFTFTISVSYYRSLISTRDLFTSTVPQFRLIQPKHKMMRTNKWLFTKPSVVYPTISSPELQLMSKEHDQHCETSPLEPAQQLSLFARILGFPICPVDGTHGLDFRFHWSSSIGLALAMGLTAVGFIITHLILM